MHWFLIIVYGWIGTSLREVERSEDYMLMVGLQKQPVGFFAFTFDVTAIEGTAGTPPICL